ncbi:hypothetical protein B5U98_27415 [Bosea sp. Tri-39]|nr:hypothetical protein B5U98_27415 [Bosea sp. Tri-39]
MAMPGACMCVDCESRIDRRLNSAALINAGARTFSKNDWRLRSVHGTLARTFGCLLRQEDNHEQTATDPARQSQRQGAGRAQPSGYRCPRGQTE